MANIIKKSQNYYYNNDEEYGSYQFTSLDDIISSFMVAYVGLDKIIPRASVTDVQFHAMRALRELSFDTFKSVKAQEIILPPTLQMILPHDYVNYTQISWTDSKGIKRPLYSTKHTSNPFSILQEEDGSYEFSNDRELVTDPGFNRSNGFLHPKWSSTKLNRIVKFSSAVSKPGANPPGTYPAAGSKISYSGGINITLGKDGGGTLSALNFSHVPQPIGVRGSIAYTSRVLAAWHRVNVQGMDTIDLGATVNVTAADDNETNSNGNPGVKPAGEVAISIQANPGDTSYNEIGYGRFNQSKNMNQEANAIGDVLKWQASDAGSDVGKSTVIDVEDYDRVYVLITSIIPFNQNDDLGFSVVHTTSSGVATGNTFTKTKADAYRNLVRQISVTNGISPNDLQHRDIETKLSSTWENYKANAPNENNNRDYTYDEDEFSLNKGRRFGLQPEHAQINGSFYIDNENGLINFSSPLSGKTIILDYISDSLGTYQEMKVHKLAEDAMYKSILYDIISTRPNIGINTVNRFRQEKRASRRTAKLRLSNIKISDITQIFRNKSKIIK
mgnify:FL=1|tara:strand:- start:19526 stop:21199 length:1674 start_codon:yes stop_codon:yes gene_type:complete